MGAAGRVFVWRAGPVYRGVDCRRARFLGLAGDDRDGSGLAADCQVVHLLSAAGNSAAFDGKGPALAAWICIGRSRVFSVQRLDVVLPVER